MSKKTVTKEELAHKMIKALHTVMDKPGGTIRTVDVEKQGDRITARMFVEKWVSFTIDGEVIDE